MGSSNFNVRLDDNLKAEATQVLAGYGLSPTQAIKLFFNQIAVTRKVPLSFDFQAETKIPNALTQQAMLEARTGIGLERYKTLDEALKAMQEIANAGD